jgi:hypothetical protein
MKFPSGLHVRQVYAVRVHAVGPGSEQRVVTRFRGPLDINHNPRNGLPYFNVSLFSLPPLGTPGTAPRRLFYGPGIANFDIALSKVVRFRRIQVAADPAGDIQHFQ